MATEVKKVYTLDIQGVDSVNDLRSAIEQLTEKLKQLNKESTEYKNTLQELTDLQSKLADAMNGVGSGTQKVSESIKSVNESASAATESINNMSQASQEVKKNLDNVGDTNTIKALKDEIKGLKEELNNLQIGSKEFNDVSTQLANSEARLKETMGGVRASVEHAKGSYNDLSQQMRILKAEYHATNDEARQNELAKQIAEIDIKLKDMDAAVGVWKRNVGNYKSAAEGFTDAFVSQKQELKQLKLAMEQLDPATQEYMDAFNRAAEITHNLSEQQQALKYASTDIGDQLSNVRGIASNLAAGYTAVNAAMGLFGEENDNVKEALLKVQQTMALVQGLEGLDGFIKRTQGLSTAMKAWIKTSQASAAATKADAAASAADAAAKGAEATATAGAVAPQLALNAAMKANPIGFIIGLIASLVTIMALLKDKIKEMIGSNDKMKESFDKLKAVLAGVGSVIKKSVINPIKMAIIPIKTLGKVMVDVFRGDWDKIGDDIKAGAEEMKDTVIDTINVVGAFKEGYEAKSAELEAQRARERAEARANELDDQIKDLEAQFGADKKYTEDAKKLYTEYFDSKIAMYEKDTDEYKQAVRDKWVYEREYQQKQQEAADKAAKEEEAAAKKAADAAKQAREKSLSDFKSAFMKYMPSGITIEFNEKDTIDKWKKGLGEFKKWIKKQYGDLANNIKFDEVWNKVLADFAKQYSDSIRTETETVINRTTDYINKRIDEMNLFYQKKEFDLGLSVPDDLLANWEYTVGEMNDLIEDSLLKTQSAKRQIEAYFKEVFSEIEDAEKREAAIREALNKDASYQALIISEKAYINQRNELVLEGQKKISDIYKQAYAKEDEQTKNGYELQERYYQNLTDLRKSMTGQVWGWDKSAKYEAEQEQVMYELRIVNLNKLAEMYKKMADDKNLSAEERKNAELELAQAMRDIEDAELAHTVYVNERKKEIYKNTIDYINTALQGTSTLLGNVADAWEASINEEVAAGKMSQQEAEKKFKNVKRVQKAQALVNTFTAAISAFQSMSSIPYVGPILGAAAAAAAIAAGMAQVRSIDSTTLNGSSAGSSSSSSSSAYQLPSVLTPEPQYTKNITGQSDTDNLANAIGDAVGNQRVYVVESDINDAQKRSRKVSVETTF